MTISNNLVFANSAAYRGGGIMTIGGGPPMLTNNTITRNRCTISSSAAQGGGILAYSGTSVNGKNNIIYDNSSTTSPNVGGTVSMTYSCVQGGLAGTGNIDSNPLFVHTPPTGYCFLSQIAAGQTQNSPCVNTGDPASGMITGSTRTDLVQDAGVVDMGFHWALNTDASAPLHLLELEGMDLPESNAPVQAPDRAELVISNHPNPFNPATCITLVLDEAAPVDLTVYDSAGRTVTNLFQGTLEAGSHNFYFSGESLPAGVYMYRAESAGRVATGKALLVK